MRARISAKLAGRGAAQTHLFDQRGGLLTGERLAQARDQGERGRLRHVLSSEIGQRGDAGG
ncbi:MAG: hypothetical protein HND48_24880 [Chloroflexi bacterium]|nr:hypothetical protein [Chloroflexota bacterium]